MNGGKNTPAVMLRGQHNSRTFGAGPVMGFSGKKAKSEFRPRWESEVGIPTSVARQAGGFYAGQVVRQGGGFNARQVVRQGGGFNARQVAWLGARSSEFFGPLWEPIGTYRNLIGNP